MLDGGRFDADKMYKDTKLYNSLFMKELTRRPADITVNSFSPGLITQGGFFRCQKAEYPMLLGVCNFVSQVTHLTETVEGGGKLLTNMAANPAYYSDANGYWSNEVSSFSLSPAVSGTHEFVAMPTSAESQDSAKA